MQNIKDWPIFIKVCFGLITTALVIAGATEIPKLNKQQKAEDNTSQKNATELLNVDIVVLSDEATSKPIENAEIRFISKGSPEVRRTDTNGFTQIDIPVRQDIEITISKEGFKQSRYTLSLSNDPNRTRKYYLQPQKKP
ncbi:MULTISPECIES: carboxypeptidase regulatory-like domain-containing protein [Pseudanabaena]|uniref:Carboxypeptidase regulatory-like domain-containing protein n=2 Tax=Pseudanabaena TaxID=1152 RepID=L8N4C8_9CYAN|nr:MULTISPECIES: carboxypeptidase regulatory-like domain-containing protein [Pseudanabaena]ELS34526.1 hypothetical protein Pse7429DRAFT_0282 [Pseudanabaena biceps PCC 7429]MDG3493297.1 carboxypeptidase regulatory-like domain-containing protein [Pseudanabaena catenata USMAC16]